MPQNFIDPLELENPSEVVTSKVTYDQVKPKGQFIDPLDDTSYEFSLQQSETPQYTDRSWLTNFGVNAISDVGAMVGGGLGAAAGMGLGVIGAPALTIGGTAVGAKTGSEIEGKVRQWLNMAPEDQLIPASEDPVINDFVNTLGFDLGGGLAAKSIAKVGGKALKGIGQSVSGATDEAVESASRLSKEGIDLQSAPAFESGNTGFFSSETLARMFAPDATEKTRKEILKSQHQAFEKITDTSFDALSKEDTFSRGQEIVEATKKGYQELLEDRGKLELIQGEKKRIKELIDKGPMEQIGTYQFKVRDVNQLKKNLDDLTNVELEILNKNLPKEAAFSVKQIQEAATKKVPLARPTIQAILAEPERVAAVLGIDNRLKETLRDEALTNLTRIGNNKAKLELLQKDKQIFEQLLPSEKSYDQLKDFYTAIEKSTAGDLVNNPAATLVTLRGSQAIIQFGKEVLTGGGPRSAFARLGGNVAGGVQATIAGNTFAKKVLLNPKYSKIAIKAAQGQRLSNRELDQFIMAMAGSKITVQGLNEAGKPKDAGKTTVLRETVAPSYPQD